MSVASTIRTAALMTTAAATLLAFSSTGVAAQQTAQTIPSQTINVTPSTLPTVTMDPAAKAAHIAKLKRVLTIAGTIPTQELPEMCNARIIGFSDAIVKYNRDPELQRILINISEDTLTNYANFVNCSERSDAKIRVVNSSYEDQFRTLMVANGIIPNSPTAYGPAYQATRRTSTLTDRSGPALAQNSK